MIIFKTFFKHLLGVVGAVIGVTAMHFVIAKFNNPNVEFDIKAFFHHRFARFLWTSVAISGYLGGTIFQKFFSKKGQYKKHLFGCAGAICLGIISLSYIGSLVGQCNIFHSFLMVFGRLSEIILWFSMLILAYFGGGILSSIID